MAMRRWGLPALATLAAMAALTAPTADAAPRQTRPAAPIEAAAPREAGEPIMAIVSIKTQHITFYDADGWILRAPVSTGTTGRETPAGVFAIVEKEKEHRSTLYDDAEMPNMQRITWNGIAMHGGPLPGYAASHGCIRLPFGFAEKLFDKTRIGMRVIISPNDAAPVEISHPVLLVPKAEAIAAAPARAATMPGRSLVAVRLLPMKRTERPSSGGPGAVDPQPPDAATDASSARCLVQRLAGMRRSSGVVDRAPGGAVELEHRDGTLAQHAAGDADTAALEIGPALGEHRAFVESHGGRVFL